MSDVMVLWLAEIQATVQRELDHQYQAGLTDGRADPSNLAALLEDAGAVKVRVEDFGMEGYGFFVGRGKESRFYDPPTGDYRLLRIREEGGE